MSTSNSFLPLSIPHDIKISPLVGSKEKFSHETNSHPLQRSHLKSEFPKWSGTNENKLHSAFASHSVPNVALNRSATDGIAKTPSNCQTGNTFKKQHLSSPSSSPSISKSPTSPINMTSVTEHEKHDLNTQTHPFFFRHHDLLEKLQHNVDFCPCSTATLTRRRYVDIGMNHKPPVYWNPSNIFQPYYLPFMPVPYSSIYSQNGSRIGDRYSATTTPPPMASDYSSTVSKANEV